MSETSERIEKLVASIASAPGVQFASFVYLAPAKGTRTTSELSRVVILLGASIENLYTRDLERLRDMLPSCMGVNVDACKAIIASRERSLAEGIGNRSDYTNKDTYDLIDGARGLKVHKVTGDVHVMGLLHRKDTLIAGEYREVNSSVMTIAKNKIAALLPSARLRQYRLTDVLRARVNGDTISLETTSQDTLAESSGIMTPYRNAMLKSLGQVETA